MHISIDASETVVLTLARLIRFQALRLDDGMKVPMSLQRDGTSAYVSPHKQVKEFH